MSPHLLPVRVYYEDTDFSGVVYHASYLRFLERGRTEYVRSLGVDQRALFAADPPVALAVRRMSLDFLKPALMDDLLTIETALADARGASLDLAQRILRGDEVLLTAGVQVAAVSRGRSVRLPEALRAALRHAS